MRSGKRLILHLKLHGLIDIFALAEPKDQIVALLQAFRRHPCIMIQLRQLKRPFFNVSLQRGRLQI